MKIGINLASEPFRRDRPVLIASAALAILLLASLTALVSLSLNDRRLMKRDRAMQARLESDLRTLSGDARKSESEIHRTENAEVLERSVLINQLLLRKGISWTKLFADLEKTLPHNVRIVQIHPVVSPANQVQLEMTVASDSPDPIITFVQNLEMSDVFGSAQVGAYQSPSQTDPFYRYRLSVNYAQKL